VLGAGSLAAPGRAAALARGFTHGVASGDPRRDGVLLWTRYVPTRGDAAPLRYEVAQDAGFGRVVARGEVLADAESDFCAKPAVAGLEPGRWYYYRFAAPDGTRSAIGRTRTLPDGPTGGFRIAAFSCANKPFGWFNAYAHAARRNDIDLVVHLGDYIYEYPRGDYPSERQALPGRIIDPATETVRLEEYRARYASYRLDADLQRLHQLFPSVNIWDDHETTNDAWKGGAQNHQPETEGDWDARMVAAKRAFREWLPMGDEDYAAYDVGDLLTLVRLDTRIEGRDKQIELAAALEGAADARAALTRLRDGPLADPSRSMLGRNQEAWLGERLRTSTRAGTRWQLLAQQVLVGRLVTSTEARPEWLGADAPDYSRRRFNAGLAAARADIPFNLDSWGGYPPARARLLSDAQRAGANLVVITGDSHNAWAFDLANDGRPAGVEFGVQSVTSPGFENSLRGVSPERVARSLVEANPELKWANTQRRGYMTLSFARDEMRCDWHLLDTVRERSLGATAQSARVARGTNRLSLG